MGGAGDVLAFVCVALTLRQLASAPLSLVPPGPFGGWFAELWIVIAAAAAYRLRTRARLGYGIIEFGAGLALVAGSIVGARPDPVRPLNSVSDFVGALPMVLSGLGGLYVMVRGLSNVEDGIKTGGNLSRFPAVRKIEERLMNLLKRAFAFLFGSKFEL